MKRRNFIVNSSLVGAGAIMLPQNMLAYGQDKFLSKRPIKSARNFTSIEVENTIKKVKVVIKDQVLQPRRF